MQALLLQFKSRLMAKSNLVLIIVFAAYFLISFMCFGWPVIGNITRNYVGGGNDPISFMWWLYWWPYAVTHGLNRFMTGMVWAPEGFNLAWATGIPGMSFLAAPITFTLGPVAAYNILMILSPALAAFTSFILIRHITNRFLPSLMGGYLFGFSTYEIGQMAGHLNLTFIFLIPLCVYLVLLLFEDKITRTKFIVFLALALTFQFLFSTEIFASMTVFGILVLALSFIIMGWSRRFFLHRMALILSAYFLAAILVSPYLYYLIAFGFPASPIHSLSSYSSDLLNIILPTPITLIGQGTFIEITNRFSGNFSEDGAYIGISLLLIISVYTVRSWHTRSGKLLIISLAAIVIASMGPVLHIVGTETLPLPWALMTNAPFINVALPARFMVYSFLIIALIAGLFLSRIKMNRIAKYMLLVTSLIFLIPNTPNGQFVDTASTPAFFSQDIYKQYLAREDTVVIIPYGDQGESMLWQAETNMYFRMAGGYVGSTPQSFSDLPIVNTFYTGNLIPDYEKQLKEFTSTHDVKAIIVADSSPETFYQLFSSLGVEPQHVGGVTLFLVPQNTPSKNGP